MKWLNYIPKPIKNIYFLTAVVFLVWIIFFDSNSLRHQIYLNDKLNDLKTQKEYYSEQLKETQKDLEELNSDPEELEKFAREKYLFKRKDEDVYIVK